MLYAKEILPTLLDEFIAKLDITSSSVVRSYQLPKAPNLVDVAIGMRRTGKTYLLFQEIRFKINFTLI